jgi:hypothetical protein
MDELTGLMHKARRRILHLYLIVAAVIAVISFGALSQTSASAAGLARLAFWLFGCSVVLVLGAVWVRMRYRDSERLPAVLAGKVRIKRVERGPVVFYVIPFGWEVEVELDPEELLDFGFWHQADAERLHELVSARQG